MKKRNQFITVPSILFLIEGGLLLFVALMVLIATALVQLKGMDVAHPGDPLSLVAESLIIGALYMAAGVMGLKHKAYQILMVLGLALAGYNIYLLCTAHADVVGTIQTIIAIVAAGAYIYGAKKAAPKPEVV